MNDKNTIQSEVVALNGVEEITPHDVAREIQKLDTTLDAADSGGVTHTMEEISLPEGHKAIRCKNCGNAIVVDRKTGLEPLMKRRDTDGIDGVIAVGFECPICKEWYHSFYTTKLLDSMRRDAELEHHPVRRSALRGKYSRRFARFQQEIKQKLAAADAARKAG